MEANAPVDKAGNEDVAEILERVADRLEGEVAPEDLFTTVPGIGDELARRIHDALEIETLEELELAAHDGRLQTVDGFGPRRRRTGARNPRWRCSWT